MFTPYYVVDMEAHQTSDSTEEATCPDCGTQTRWYCYINGDDMSRFRGLCDGCQADRAVAAAYEGTDY